MKLSDHCIKKLNPCFFSYWSIPLHCLVVPLLTVLTKSPLCTRKFTASAIVHLLAQYEMAAIMFLNHIICFTFLCSYPHISSPCSSPQYMVLPLPRLHTTLGELLPVKLYLTIAGDAPLHSLLLIVSFCQNFWKTLGFLALGSRLKL